MKIAYLHGLESDNIGPKNDWLKNVAEVYDPLINYNEKGIYKRLLKEVKEFAPDIIIGSSMGGYFSYEIAKTLSIPALLFNPALHSRSFQPDTTGLSGNWNNPKMHIVFGKTDDVINPHRTLDLIDQKKMTWEFFNHAHQTPSKVFIREVKKFAKL